MPEVSRSLLLGLLLLGFLAPATRAQAPSSPPTPAAVDSVVALTDGQRYAEAESLATDLLAEYEQTYGPESFEVGRTLDALADSRWRQGGEKAGDETMAQVERAIAIKQALFGPDHPEVARSLGVKAGLLLAQRDLPAAIEVRQEALAILRRHPEGDPAILASTLANLGILHAMMARYEEATPYFEESYEVYRKGLGENDPDTGLAAFSLGNIHYMRADYAAAEEAYREALDIFEVSLEPDHPRTIITLYSLAGTAKMRGDYAGARACYERGLELGEQRNGPESPQLVRNLRGLGGLCVLLGDDEAGLGYYQRALAIAEKTEDPDSYDLWPELANMGHILQRMDRDSEARPYLTRAIALIETRSPDLDVVIEPLCELALVEQAEGRPEAAIDTLTRALRIANDVLGPTNRTTGDVHSCLAAVYTDLGDPGAAAPHLEGAVAAYESGWRDDQNYARALLQRGRGRLAAGDAAGAFADAEAAEEAAREHFVSTARTLSERAALNFSAFRGNGIPLMLSILARDANPSLARVTGTWDAVVRSRSLLLDEVAERVRLARGAGSDEFAELSAAVLDARTRLANLYLQGPEGEDPELFAARLEALSAAKEEAETALAEKSVTFRAGAGARRAGFAEMAGALPPGGALVAYVRYPRSVPAGDVVDSYAAFVLRDGSGAPVFIDLGNAAGIDDRVIAWRSAITGSAVPSGPLAETAAGRLRETGDALRAAVLDPLPLQGSDPVLVVPDGALHFVNPAALPAADGTFLVETGPLFHLLPTESAILPGEDPEPGRDLLVLGGPDFGADVPATPEPGPLVAARMNVPLRGAGPDCEAFRGLTFADLPGAAAEAREVAEIWDDAFGKQGSETTLVGPEATEAAFKENAAGHAVLHLATHGYFLESDCLGGDPGAVREVVQGNPMLLSGLALAGSNTRRPGAENGILTAEEIATLDLEGTRWVVLSACDTGRGELRASEGLYGLQRAFQTAGARTVVMSLWAVDDQATRSWMEALYRHRWEDGASTAEAVRQASRDVLRDLRKKERNPSPVTWGAFVASGDWR